jgi:hypothetical protein
VNNSVVDGDDDDDDDVGDDISNADAAILTASSIISCLLLRACSACRSTATAARRLHARRMTSALCTLFSLCNALHLSCSCGIGVRGCFSRGNCGLFLMTLGFGVQH